MTMPELHTLAQIFAGRLINTAGAGIVIAMLVWLLLRLIGRQNSGTRFAIWFSALLAIVALPFFGESRFAASHSTILSQAGLLGRITLSSSWAYCLFAAWTVGAGLSLLSLILGLWRVRQIRRNCVEVDLTGLDPAITGILRDFAPLRQVMLCVSADVAVPAAIGFFQPAIVFPAWLLPQLSAAEIQVILLHELAHLRRWDDWSNLFQKMVKAVFFFHPAVWWIEDRLTLEREMACDDIVLAQTPSPRAYVSSLISFAEKLQNARGLALAQALVSRMHQMSLRVAQILDAKRPRRTGLWKPVLGLNAGMLALVLCAAPYMPRVVAFQTRSNGSSAQQMQAMERTVTAEAQPVVAHKSVSLPETERVAQPQRFAPQPRAIPATFNPRVTVIPTRLKALQAGKPAVRIAKAAQEELPHKQTIVILQTTQYDASGSAVWTFCIWKVGERNLTERQVESAIIASLI